MVLDRTDHVEKDWTHINKLGLRLVTIRTVRALANPIFNTRRTEDLVVAMVTFYWISAFNDNLVANSTDNIIFYFFDFL